VACAGVSDAGLAGGGESGSLSAAKPKRSFDGSFGAEDLSGNGALVVALNRLPFITGVVFFAFCWDSEASNTSPGGVLVGEVGERMFTSGLSSTAGGGVFFCLFKEGVSPPAGSSPPPRSSVAL
jgi:hypothetical protein